jgi:hypothetical protein
LKGKRQKVKGKSEKAGLRFSPKIFAFRSLLFAF